MSVSSISSTPTAPPTTEQTNNGDANVEFVRVVQTAPDVYTFYVTVRHADTGWEDYADGWDVVLPTGGIVQATGDDAPFTRLLLHPHEDEQPFTRSQSGLQISAEITTLTVRAHDLRDGFGGQVVTVDLTQAAGANFTVERP